MVRTIIPDQKTVLDSEKKARAKNEEFLGERSELREYSTLETVVIIVLGLVALGFVVFVLRNYF